MNNPSDPQHPSPISIRAIDTRDKGQPARISNGAKATSTSPPSPIDKARHYINSQPPAVSGKGGHNQTFKVACSLVRRFRLSREQAWQLLNEYNERCRPRWTPEELKHKLDDAIKANPARALDAGAESTSAPEPADLPEVFTRIAQQEQRPSRTSLRPYRYEDLQQLSRLRGIGIPALLIALMRGVLVFGTWHGHEVWGIADRSQRVLEYRRLDGALFPPYGKNPERKSHSVKGSPKAWPIGIQEAQQSPCIALVEGGADFLACHELILREGAFKTCAPVAILSASPRIHQDGLPLFRNKVVRIFPHADKDGAGFRGAAKWQSQLREVGAASVDIFDFSMVRRKADVQLKDLNEFINVCDENIRTRFPFLNNILPTESYDHS